MTEPQRFARIVQITPDGVVRGVLAPVPVATPWWQDIAPVVSAVRERHGVDITVLRLLEADKPSPHGGMVTYLAETADPAPAEAWDGRLDEQPLRLPYAKVGGPAADLAWARAALAETGMTVDEAVQIRTWNLSSIWRLRAGKANYWLKVTPPFMAHEGAVIATLAGGPVPPLVAHDGPRILMPEIPGEDAWAAADEPVLGRMVDLLVDLQQRQAGRAEGLLRLGANDFRAPALVEVISTTFERNADSLAGEARAQLARFVAALDETMAAVAACGLPDTLVHGDYHAGNLVWDDERLTILDWGDSGVGNPMLDEPAFFGRRDADVTERLRRRWCEAWRRAAPGSDPARASRLLGPVSLLRQAAIYQAFLDQIEPSEHPYHRDDPGERLQRAAEMLAAKVG